MAFKDDLTRLSNSRHFNLGLVRELECYHCVGEPFSLVFPDLDHFKSFNKSFNDTHGHQGLGQYPQVRGRGHARDGLGHRSGRALRREDLVLFLPYTSKEAVLVAPEWLRGAVAEKLVCNFEYNCGSVTVSAGVASSPEQADFTDELVRREDQAL